MNRPIEIHEDVALLSHAEKLALLIRVVQTIYAAPDAALAPLLYITFATALGVDPGAADRLSKVSPKLLTEYQARIVFEQHETDDTTPH